jgi:four helix bundle protein
VEKFRFLKWKVYQDAKELFVLILNVVKKIPKEYRFELGSQIIRASLSILLNIAEGSGKNSDRELNRFIDISLGSLNETLAAIDVLKDTKLITESDFNKIFKLIDEISNQLGGFKKKITSYKL